MLSFPQNCCGCLDKENLTSARRWAKSSSMLSLHPLSSLKSCLGCQPVDDKAPLRIEDWDPPFCPTPSSQRVSVCSSPTSGHPSLGMGVRYLSQTPRPTQE